MLGCIDFAEKYPNLNRLKQKVLESENIKKSVAKPPKSNLWYVKDIAKFCETFLLYWKEVKVAQYKYPLLILKLRTLNKKLT